MNTDTEKPKKVSSLPRVYAYKKKKVSSLLPVGCLYKNKLIGRLLRVLVRKENTYV